VAFLAPVLLAIVAFEMAAPVYVATAKILIRAGREFDARNEVGQPSGGNAPVSTKQEVINSELEILSSRDLAETTISAIGVAALFPRLSPGATPRVTMDRALDNFAKDFTARPANASDIIDLAFAAPTAELAVVALRELIARYQQKHVAVFSRPISDFLDVQLTALEQNLRSLESEITAYKVKNNVFNVAEQRRDLLETRNNLANTVTQLRSHAAELETRIGELNGLKRQTPETLYLYSETDQSDAYERARSQLLDLRLKEHEAAAHYTDNSRVLREIRSRIATIEEFLASQAKQFSGRVRNGRNPLYDEIVAEIARAQAEIAPQQTRAGALDAEIARIDERLKTLEGADQMIGQLDRQHDVLATNLKTYRQRQEDARLLEELDRQKIVSLSLVQDASAQVTPARPRLFFYLACGIGAGVIASLGIIGLLFAFRNTYIAPEGAERSTGIPVLVSLPSRG
jgi:uncharacterized protein involved in exopolysaccharide biosynthesis